jgi:hypothetical protein
VNAPDYAEAIVAWRVWLVVVDGEEIRLSSVVHKTVWTPRRELTASCDRRMVSFPRVWRKTPSGHAAPAERCRCGIYGAKDLVHAARYLVAINPARCLPTTFWLDPPRSPLFGAAIGRVSLWGLVVECEHGWRASRAYPRELYLFQPSDEDGSLPPQDEVAARLAVYGIPIGFLSRDVDSPDDVATALRGVAIRAST